MHTYESRVLGLKEVPAFSLADVSQIVSGRGYAKVLLGKLVDKGEVRRLKPGLYSFHDDDFLVSTSLAKPSYISSMSALQYHRLVSQMPNAVFCFTTGRGRSFSLNAEVRFVHTGLFFGFQPREYRNFMLPIADPEKAIIDSIGLCPVSLFEEALGSVDLERMLSYLARIGKSSVAKRVGFLLERKGFEVYKGLKGMVNARYVQLDPLAKRAGKRDKKWGVVVNA